MDAKICIFMRNISDQDYFKFRYYISRIIKEAQGSWIGQFKEERVLELSEVSFKDLILELQELQEVNASL